MRFLSIILFGVLWLTNAFAQTYTQMQWGLDKTATPYNFGANIGGTWRTLGTVSSLGVWAIPSTNISGLATSATTDTTNASNITSGTLAGARLPAPQAGVLGGVLSSSAGANQFMTGVDGTGAPTYAQPTADNVSGLGANLSALGSAATSRTNLGLGTSAVVDTGTSGTKVPLLDGVNTWSGAQTFSGGATVPFTQTGTGAVASTVDEKLKQAINIVDFGADPTGVSDSTTAISNAITAASNKIVFVPPGTFKLTDKITLPTGTTLACSGRTKSIFSVDSASFNMAATGVIAFGSDATTLEGCGIVFTQPDTTLRASLNAYPPAIYAVGSTRFKIKDVRISAAYTCLNATGNAGGSMIDNLECGALASSNVIAFDGALDFVHINRLECWPFGINGLTNTYNSIYRDQTTNCMTIGRVDGFAADTISSFLSSVVFTTNATIGGIPFMISNLQLDVTGSLVVNSGRVNIMNFYATTGSSTTVPAVTSTGNLSFVTIHHVDDYVDGSLICNYKATNSGALTIMGGYLYHTDTASPAACVDSGGYLEIDNTRVTIMPTNRTAAYFDQSGASSVMVLNGVASGLSGGATGNAFSFATDNARNRVTNSTFPGWAHSFGFTTSSGFYDLAESDSCTFTPSFSTPGDSVLTETATSCTYYRKGTHAYFNASTTFNTNAYTTAAGNFMITGTFPPAVSGDRGDCALTDVQYVTSGAIQFAPYLSNSVVYIRQWSSNAAPALHSTANVPASKTGVVYAMSCYYRVK